MSTAASSSSSLTAFPVTARPVDRPSVRQVVSSVQRRTGMSTYADAERAVYATLTVLGQRLPAAGDALAEHLPAELAGDARLGDVPEPFGLDEFYRRVSRAEGRRCPVERGRRHARAVAATLREVGPPALGRALDLLPHGFADLTGTLRSAEPLPRAG